MLYQISFKSMCLCTHDADVYDWKCIFVETILTAWKSGDVKKTLTLNRSLNIFSECALVKENDVFSKADAYKHKLDEIDVPIIFEWRINFIEINYRNTDLIQIRSHDTRYSRSHSNFSMKKE